MPRVLVVVQNNFAKVFTDDPDVQVVVADRDVDVADCPLKIDGAPVGLETLLEGLPMYDPDRVAAAYAELPLQLASVGLPSLPQKDQAQLTLFQESLGQPH